MSKFFVAVAGLIHIYIFCLESLLWGRPKTNRIFGMSADTAETNRLFAFNQGFYNLFLSLAAIGGLCVGDDTAIGRTLVSYSLLSMMLAAIVLICSTRKLLRPALIQGIPPLMAMALLVAKVFKLVP